MSTASNRIQVLRAAGKAPVSSDTAYEACLLGMIARAEANCDAQLAARREAAEAGDLVPSLAEQRLDKLRMRGLDRAARTRQDNVPGVSWVVRSTPWRVVG